MIVYPREWSRRQNSAFASIASAAGGGRRLAFIGLSLRSFPETRARAAEAMARAKRQPKGRIGRALKSALIAAQYTWARRYFARHPGDVAMCWNGLTGSRRAFMQGALDAGARRLFVELAPLPGRITLDPLGVNAESSVPQGRAFYDDWSAGDPARSGEGWREAGAGLTARASRRADVGQGSAEGLGAAPFLFVPLQVPDDSQMRLFAGWAGSLDGFVAALGEAARALPEGWHLRVKEHPSAKVSLAPQLAAATMASGGRIVTDNATDSFAQVAASRGVVTINSSMGLQAFFHDKPVIATGRAFWAQPGLVTVADSAEALRAAFAGAGALAFDAGFRARFMAWLDREYYLRVTETPEGDWQLDPAAVCRVLATAPRP
ncbi:capsular biosynthesis protein [Frigidibacter mobilis]|uniref:Polysaccharide synthesis/modification protein n=1 Tax=Frigidibacter mobilis TaxID=1335048 RepID=A0A159Z8N1_9RHOB|nr:capsular biosynthesis protein [Frigidibacter mobilis]AMY71882.1 polysaccharide synthesis/modification protein [Frigidibacter mobilis]